MHELHLSHNPDTTPQEWRVEEIDSDGRGSCDVAIFTGPHAAERARRLFYQVMTGVD